MQQGEQSALDTGLSSAVSISEGSEWWEVVVEDGGGKTEMMVEDTASMWGGSSRVGAVY
jgi:hypothetical protein